MRDRNGKTHVVDVIEEGFVFQAKVHKSLTAVARQITGAHWSGPRFIASHCQMMAVQLLLHHSEINA